MIYYATENIKIVFCVRNPLYALLKNKRMFCLRANKFKDGRLVLFYKNYSKFVLLINLKKFIKSIDNEI